MSERQTHAVTGAFGYSGKYIAQRLLDKGHKVITLRGNHREEKTHSLGQPSNWLYSRHVNRKIGQ